MKILEWLLNFAIDIATLWGRTSDKVLNQHREYERRTLVCGFACLVFLIICIQTAPSIQLEPTVGISYVVYELKLLTAKVAIWFSAIAGLASIYNLIGLFCFRYEHGIEE